MSLIKVKNYFIVVALLNFIAAFILLFGEGRLAKVASFVFFISFVVSLSKAIRKAKSTNKL